MADESNDFEMVDVVSGRVKQIGHNGKDMKAVFPNGKQALYSNVTRETFDAVMGAPSVGTAFGQLIVNGGYNWKYV